MIAFTFSSRLYSICCSKSLNAKLIITKNECCPVKRHSKCQKSTKIQNCHSKIRLYLDRYIQNNILKEVSLK